jgi:hypothetical protein
VTTRAAIGFRAHSGWAAAVAVSGPKDAPLVVGRRRIELVDGSAAGKAQPYHAAAAGDPRDAERLIASSAESARSLAQQGLAAFVEELRKAGYEAVGCGILLAAGRPLPALESILASHPLIHTAEGEFFREALRAAAGACELPLISVKEREIFTRASMDLGIPADRLERHVVHMGQSIGPPWRQDEKLAAMAAWLALTGVS